MPTSATSPTKMESRADENLDRTFESLCAVMGKGEFRTRHGLGGNELPFYISAFHASLQSRVDSLVPNLVNRLRNQGLNVLHLDLYTLTTDLLKARSVWDRLVEREPATPKDRFLQTLQNLTDPKDSLVPKIAEELQCHRPQILVITGVGLVFPYLRSHRVLENLQSVTKQTPTVMFFPGDYAWVEGKGSYLKLFGSLPDDRYYRAHNIADFFN